MIALGKETAALFSNNDELVNNLIKCGYKSNENLWRLPI